MHINWGYIKKPASKINLELRYIGRTARELSGGKIIQTDEYPREEKEERNF